MRTARRSSSISSTWKSADTNPSGSPRRKSGTASRKTSRSGSTANVGVAVAVRAARAAMSAFRAPSSTVGAGSFGAALVLPAGPLARALDDTAPATTDQGQVTHTWVAGETETVGRIFVNVEAVFAGKKQTFPPYGSLAVDVTPAESGA